LQRDINCISLFDVNCDATKLSFANSLMRKLDTEVVWHSEVMLAAYVR